MAEVPIERVGVKVKGLLIARCVDEAPRCRGGATHGNGLGTCHSKGASMVVEEDATAMKEQERTVLNYNYEIKTKL